jgi:hypothetical protein
MSSTDLAEIQAVVDGGLEKAGFMDSAPDVQFVASLAAVSVLSRRVMMFPQWQGVDKESQLRRVEGVIEESVLMSHICR